MSENFLKLKTYLDKADAILIGAGAGLSASAGFYYGGERFLKYFADFHEKYGISDMYSGGFYPFESQEEYWAWWSRHIFYNRYVDAQKPVYDLLYDIVKDRDYFVLTTNVDHCFQKSGFDKERLFYTQGDYGLFQCSTPCHDKTYDNEDAVRRMVAEQKDMRIPSNLIPYCPVCGMPMTVNLRSDDSFVEDEGWHKARKCYGTFIEKYKDKNILLLELGVGMNTPVIIKYPFWRLTAQNEKARYACINLGEAYCPSQIGSRSVCINGDIFDVISQLAK